MTETLYDRLGATEGITKIANDLVDNHVRNPLIGRRFAQANVDGLKKAATAFVVSGTGGPNIYEGKDMIGTHKGMNINGDEFVAVLDDALNAMEKNNVGQREKEEIVYILVSMRKEVMGQ